MAVSITKDSIGLSNVTTDIVTTDIEQMLAFNTNNSECRCLKYGLHCSEKFGEKIVGVLMTLQVMFNG